MRRTGERFGTEHLINILKATTTDSILQYGHDKLPTFGVGSERSRQEWRSILRQIYAAGLVSLEVAEFGRWVITEAGAEVLRGKAKVELRADTLPAPRRERGERKTTAAVNTDLDPADATLLVHLKDLRRSLATGAGVPAYVVFPDRTLLELAARRPKSLEQMRAIHGVGAAKLARYGETFLQAIAGAA